MKGSIVLGSFYADFYPREEQARRALDGRLPDGDPAAFAHISD
jgi:hypothetical protein